MEVKTRRWGITALTVFFLAGAAISLTAGVSLFLPDSFRESIWRLNPRAHEKLTSLGVWGSILLTTVSALCAAAAIGLWRRLRWGYWITVCLIGINLIANVTNVLLGTEPRAIVGIPIAAAILAYLMRKKVREAFRPQT
jgi:hypothetical protein